MTTQKEKAERFVALHARPGAFLIPNPWDAGSAKLLEGLGFEALATTSAGFANAIGKLDGQVTLEEKIEHCRTLAAATDIPVSADLENGFADDPRTAAENIRRVALAGIVGGSIEDYSGKAIYDFGLAVERVQAAVEMKRKLDFPFTLTARAEGVLRRAHGLDEAIKRLQAYEAAGADVLYAPGLTDLADVRRVASAVKKPINVLMMMRGVTLAQLADAGAKRVSLGGSLARAAVTALIRASREMLAHGSFGWTADLASGGEVTKLLTRS